MSLEPEGVMKFSQETRGARRWNMSGEADIEANEELVSLRRERREGGSLEL